MENNKLSEEFNSTVEQILKEINEPIYEFIGFYDAPSLTRYIGRY